MRFSCVDSVTGRPSRAQYQVAAASMSLTGMKTCPMRLINGEEDVTSSRLDEDWCGHRALFATSRQRYWPNLPD